MENIKLVKKTLATEKKLVKPERPVAPERDTELLSEENNGFRQISPGLGEANVPIPQVDPATGQPIQQAMPLPQPQSGGNSIQSKLQNLSSPLPQPAQQIGFRRKVFRILPIKRRTKFAV